MFYLAVVSVFRLCVSNMIWEIMGTFIVKLILAISCMLKDASIFWGLGVKWQERGNMF